MNDYAGVDEFQARGAPHTHLLLWADDSKQYDVHPIEDVIAYMDRYVTRDALNLPAELVALQTHCHLKAVAVTMVVAALAFQCLQWSQLVSWSLWSLRDYLKMRSLPSDNWRKVKNALCAANKASKDAEVSTTAAENSSSNQPSHPHSPAQQ